MEIKSLTHTSFETLAGAFDDGSDPRYIFVISATVISVRNIYVDDQTGCHNLVYEADYIFFIASARISGGIFSMA